MSADEQTRPPSKRRLAKAAREAFGTQARTLVSQLLRGFVEIDRLERKDLTAFALWFVDDPESRERLVAVVAPAAIPESMDTVLAFGLAWQGDGDLILIAPQDLVGPRSTTLQRLACIDTPVRVFGYDPDELTPVAVPIPALAEVLHDLRMDEGDPRRQFGETVADDRYGLAAALIEWAEAQHPRLLDRSRATYRCWHYRAGQVLKVRPTRRGVEVTAGSAKVLVGDGQRRVVEVTQGVDTASVLEGAKGTVHAAMEAIRDGVGRPDVEHRLQAALVPDPRQPSPVCTALGLEHTEREYPAWRGVPGESTGKPGLIDFLGIDAGGRLHVVETKANPDDPPIVLQTLDYALWARANLDRIRRQPAFVGATEDFPVLDFVCAPKRVGGKAIGQYMRSQLEALCYEQGEWHVWTVEDPDQPVPSWGVRRRMPESPLVAAQVPKRRAWPFLVRETLGQGNGEPESRFLPIALLEYRELERRHLTHRHVLSKYSSQALALNLFGEIPPENMPVLFKEHLGNAIRRFDRLEFEFEDEQDRLGELRAGHRHRTQVDVMLDAETFDGDRWVALIECKFTEPLSTCSGYADEANDDRGACRSVGLFGGDEARCWKLKESPGEGRRYGSYLAGIPVHPPQGLADCGGCPVRGELYQPMRSLALAEVLLATGEADRVTYGLCAPQNHHAAWRRLAELQALFPDTERRTIRGVPVESAAMNHADRGAAFRALYEPLFEPVEPAVLDFDTT